MVLQGDLVRRRRLRRGVSSDQISNHLLASGVGSRGLPPAWPWVEAVREGGSIDLENSAERRGTE